MNNISETRFTLEEMKVISRALNYYSIAIGEDGNPHSLDSKESRIAGEIASRIYRENFRIDTK